MELNTESILLQEGLTCPAFLVADGIIVQVNTAAQHLVNVGTRVHSLVVVGAEEYDAYRAGKLYLQLNIQGIPTGAYVSKCGTMRLFCLESAYRTPEFRVLALAAQQLRTPLSSAMINMDLLQNNPVLQEDAQAKVQLSQLNRGLYQLLRAVGNMADASGAYVRADRQESCNASSLFEEMMQKVSALLDGSNRTIVFKGLSKSVVCPVDTDLLERAVLNLLSNAIKFSPEGSTIQTSLRLQKNRLIFTVENTGIDGPQMNAFRHFIREPGIDNNPYGIGLGMSIVLTAATAHGGTVLFNSSQNHSVKVVLTIATNRPTSAILESPMRFIGGHTGGLDSLLVELADVLPDAAYE